MNGITGSSLPDPSRVAGAVERIKSHTDLPICVGFGVKTAEHARLIGAHADGVVVGTAIVNQVATNLTADGRATSDTVQAVATLVRGLATGVRSARLAAADYVRPRINSMLGRRDVPDNLWIKCPETGEMVFHKDLEENKWVIPASGYHMKMPAKARLADIFDGGQYEALVQPKVAQD
eukprot:gene68805-94295_t